VTTKIGSGATPLGGEAVYKSSGIPLIRSLNVYDDSFRTKDLAFIDDNQAAKLENAVVDAGDVLLNITGASVTRCCIAPIEFLPARVNQHVSIIRTIKQRLLPEFLHYLLISRDYKNKLLAVGEDGGSTRQAITKAQLLEFEIEFPPLAEQQRIVAVLDEAFAGLATAQAHAEKNLQNARELFDSCLDGVFTQRGEGWERITLEELLLRGWIESHLDGNHGGDYPRKEEFIVKGIPYISANCIEDMRVVMAKSKFLSPARAAMLRKGIARNNDVLFAHNATVGPVAILKTSEAKVIFGTSLTYYRCNNEHIVPEYLAHYMRSSEFTAQYSQVMKQSTRNQVPITKQREFFHIIPPIDEQKQIMRSLDELLENTQRLTKIYEQKLAALAELKKSLLHQAFSGEL
jgi:type I restriction enzyme S subunit